MHQSKEETAVNLEGGEVEVEEEENLIIEFALTGRQRLTDIGWYVVGAILVASFLVFCLSAFSQYPMPDELHLMNSTYELKKAKFYAFPYIPTVSFSQKSLEAGGKFESVCKQQHVLEWLKCIANRKQQHETASTKTLKIRRDATSNEIEETYDYIDFHIESSSSCRIPKGLRTAEVECKMWTHYIMCTSHCADGMTYEEGNVRTHFCKHKDNKWYNKFEECKRIPLVEDFRVTKHDNFSYSQTNESYRWSVRSNSETEDTTVSSSKTVGYNVTFSEIEVDTVSISKTASENMTISETERENVSFSGIGDDDVSNSGTATDNVTISETGRENVSFSGIGDDTVSNSKTATENVSYSVTKEKNVSYSEPEEFQ